MPEIVLTELLLPDVRGYNFARSLRSLVDHDLLVIALTRVPEEFHARTLMTQFDIVLRKPVDIAALHQRMVAHSIRLPRAS